MGAAHMTATTSVGGGSRDLEIQREAGTTTRAEFDDCEVMVGSGSTTLRAELPDQDAVWGLVQRIIGLGLVVTDLHLVTPPPLP
jgi:hypothetical protein